jgi:hypothetical protein
VLAEVRRVVRDERSRREDGEPWEFGQGRLSACNEILARLEALK